VKEHFWFTMQPIDEPDEAKHLRSLIEWIGVDRMLFSSDYPHWDFDDPRFAIKTPLTESRTRQNLQRQRPRAVQALKNGAPYRRPNHGDPARRQQGGCHRRPRHCRVPCQRRVLSRCSNRCPHEGAPLDKAACVARLTSSEPGVYQRSRVGELAALRLGMAGNSTCATANPISIRPAARSGPILS